jgi:hypothetical protein
MAWTVIQSATTAASSSSASSVAATYTTQNLTAGTKLIAALGWASGSTQTASSVKDPGGTNFTAMGHAPNGSGPSGCDLWQLDTPAGDVGTKPAITAQFTGNTNASMVILEVSGLATGTTTTAVLDGTAGTKTGFGGGSTGSPTYSSTAASELLVTVYGDNGGPETLGTPAGMNKANVSGNSFGDCGIAWGNSAGGTDAGSWPLSGTSADWGVILVAFKLAFIARPPLIIGQAINRAANY